MFEKAYETQSFRLAWREFFCGEPRSGFPPFTVVPFIIV